MAEDVQISGLSFNITSDVNDSIKNINKLTNTLRKLENMNTDAMGKNIASAFSSIQKALDGIDATKLLKSLETLDSFNSTISKTANNFNKLTNMDVSTFGNNVNSVFSTTKKTLEGINADKLTKSLTSLDSFNKSASRTNTSIKNLGKLDMSAFYKNVSLGFEMMDRAMNRLDVEKLTIVANNLKDIASSATKATKNIDKVANALNNVKMPSGGDDSSSDSSLGAKLLDKWQKGEMASDANPNVDKLSEQMADFDGADELSDLLKGLTGETNEASEGLNDMAVQSNEWSSAMGRMGTVASGFTTVLSVIEKGLSALHSLFDMNTSSIASFASSFTGAITNANGLGGVLSSIGGAVSGFAESLKGIATNFASNSQSTGLFKGALSALGSTVAQTSSFLMKLGGIIGGSLIRGVTTATKRIGGMAKELTVNLIKGGVNKLTSPFTRASKAISTFTRSLARIAFYRAIRSVIKGITDSLSQGTSNLYQWSNMVGGSFAPAMDKLATEANYLKNSIAAMVSPLIEAVTPAVEKIIDTMVKGINVANQFFSALTGKKTWTRATKQAQKWSTDTSKSAKKAKKSFEPFLLSFDELNKLPEKTKDTSSKTKDPNAVKKSTFKTEPVNKKISGLVDQLKALARKGDWEGIGAKIAEGANAITKDLDDWINKKFRPFGVKWASRIGRILNGFVDKYDWKLLGKTIADGINACFDIVNTFLTTFKWRKFGNKIGDMLNSAIKNIDWKLIGATFANGFNALFGTIDGILEKFHFEEFGKDIAKAFNSFTDTIDFVQITDTFANGLNGITDTIDGFFTDAHLTKFGNKVGDALQYGLDKINFEKMGTTLAKGLNGLSNTVNSILGSINFMDLGTRIGTSLNLAVSNINWTGIGTTLATGVNSIVGFFDGTITVFHDHATDWGQKVADGLNKAIGNIRWGEIGDTLRYGISGILNSIGGLVDGINWDNVEAGLVTGLNGVVKGLEETNWSKIFNGLGKMIGSAINGILRDFDWGGLVTTAIKFISSAIGGIAKALNTIDWEGIGEAIVKNIGYVLTHTDWLTVIKNIFNAIIALIKGLGGIMLGIGKAIFNGIAGALKNVDWGSVGKNILEGIKNGLAGIVGILLAPFKAFWNAVLSFFGIHSPSKKGESMGGNIVAGIKNGIANLGGTLLGIVKGAWGKVKSFMADNPLTSTAKKAFDGIRTTASGIFSKVKSTVGGAMEKVRSAVGSKMSSAQQSMALSTAKMLGVADKDMPLVKQAINGNMEASRSLMAKYPKLFNGYGTDMMKNLRNGITGFKDKVVDSVKGVADDIASFLHFSEPDEGALSNFHTWMPDFMQGLATDIDSNKKRVVQAVKGMSNDMSATMNGTVADVSGQMQANVNANANVAVNTGNDGIVSLLNQLVANTSQGRKVSVNVNGKNILDAVVDENNKAIARTGLSPFNND